MSGASVGPLARPNDAGLVKVVAGGGLTPAPVLVVLVGELNPYGTDGRYALYDEPTNASGYRLRRLVLGLPRRVYLGPAIRRHNLCVGRWSMPAARDAAARLHEPYPEATFVLLGRKVAAAFGFAHVAAFSRAEDRYVLIPHPSGLCREWADPQAVPRVRALLAEAVPGIPWGWLDRDTSTPSPPAAAPSNATTTEGEAP